MESTALEHEQKYLKISALGNVVVGTVGITVAAVSSSQAILLDGLFNLTYFATGLFTVRVASLVAGGDDERFPHGYAFFEPLINGMKGMLVLGVSIMALVGAVQALLAGGRAIEVGPAVGYGIIASMACWVVAMVTRRGAQVTGSPLVQADAENWIVNAAISSCVLLAFAGIVVLQTMGLDDAVPYVDPVIVLTIVLISIGVPVRMAKNALLGLLNRAPSSDVVQQVTDIVDANLAALPVEERFVRVVQPGRQRMVLVHVVLPTEYRPDGLREFDTIRSRTHEALCEAHVATFVDVLFTTDRKWGAPWSDGGFGGPTKIK
jgi:predicted Co/Zn/Cd cation transporter (cation efflux family)